MSLPPWQDRRGMFQKGKAVHEPSRRASQSTSGGVAEAVRKASVSSIDEAALGKTPSSPASAESPTAGRRRSSAASGGLFGNLNNMKRGSEDYGERRASHSEMVGSGGNGLVSGWFNSTFRGVKKPEGPQSPTTAPK